MYKVISPHQASFVKDRSIKNNIMLTQEMVHNISKPGVNGNVVMKPDMIKTFDSQLELFVSYYEVVWFLRGMGGLRLEIALK